MNSTVQFWWFCILSFKFGGDRSPGPLALEGMAHLIPSNTSRPTRLTRCHAIIPLETPARLNYLCAHLPAELCINIIISHRLVTNVVPLH